MSTITRETPGVYIEEITGPGVIQGVSTSIAAFVGPTRRGVSTRAIRVTSFDQFLERFGATDQPHLYDAAEEPFYLSFALQGFFQNGGQRAYVARVTNGARAWLDLLNTDGRVEAVARAADEGADGNSIRVAVQPSTKTWTLAAPSGTVAAQGPASPPPGFKSNDQQLLDLTTNPSGFAAGDSIQIVMPPGAPVVDNPGDQSSAVGDTVSLPLAASSASGGPLTFAAAGLPAGLTIDGTGRITGTPTTAGAPANVTVTVTDGGQASVVTFGWSVYEAVPTITPLGTQFGAVGTPVNVQIQAQSTAPTPGPLSFAAAGLPAGLNLDAGTGLITGQPTAAGFDDVAVTVTEGGASATTRFSWVVDPPTAPVVDNPGDQQSAVGAPVTLAINVAAAAGGVLAFTGAGLPPGLAIDPNSGQITGTPTAVAQASVTVTVTEGGAQSNQVTFDWDVVEPLPTLANPGRQSNNVGETVSLAIVAQTAAGTVPAFAATGLPAGVTIDPATGLISGHPTTPGFVDVAVSVTAGGTATTRFAWVVPKPVLASIERVQDNWIRLADPPVPNTSGQAWPGAVVGATVGLVDYPADESQIRLDLPAAPAALPLVGTWIDAGAGADTQSFRIERVSSSGVVTIGGRVPGQVISLQRHRNLTSQGFDLVVTSASGAVTSIPDLSLDPISERYLLTEGVVPSDVITVEAPEVPLFKLPRRMASSDLPLHDGRNLDLDTLGEADYRRALDLLERVDEVSMVCVPDAARYDEARRITRRSIQNAQLTHCLQMADRIALFDPPAIPRDPNDVEDMIDSVVNDLRSTRGFGVLYYPWLQVSDPRVVPPRPPSTLLIPPSGHIAGVMARTDTERGVFKAPANVAINEVLGVELQLTDREQAPLNVAGVNVLRVLPGSNRVIVWGARTTVDPFVTDWLYVNVRRLLLMIEESIQEAIRWAVFEPNDLGLWKALTRVITAFLREQWRGGALFGAEESEAFRVRIDEGLNPPSTRNKGYLFIEIKVAPVRPAEFIVVRIGLFDGGADIEEL
jgi:phage tail sheath protein FI